MLSQGGLVAGAQHLQDLLLALSGGDLSEHPQGQVQVQGGTDLIVLLLTLEEGGQMAGTELVQAILVILGLVLLLLLICLPGIVGGLEAIAVKVAVGFDVVLLIGIRRQLGIGGLRQGILREGGRGGRTAGAVGSMLGAGG